ncbi:MAG: hypothetical protein ACLFVJ_22795 [Persicimonas sp.]
MTQPEQGSGSDDNVVDARRWLEQSIESLLDAGEFVRAISALNRLLAVADTTETKLYCYENLGVIAYREGELEDAYEAFEQAAGLSSTDPGLSYALGHCAGARASWWRALMHYLAAVHHARDRVDEAEFIRAAAVAMEHLGYSDTALSMFLGALDRSPDNPWILESISKFYEQEGRWFEALDVQEALIDVLADGLPTHLLPESVTERADHPSDEHHADNPQIDRLIRRFMALWTIDREAIEQRVVAITERLRSEIGPARDDHSEHAEADAGLSPLNLPAGLHLLVEQLAGRERNFLLLESAQSLWARARHDRFDIHLTPYKLAAAIQAIVERLHWRVPTAFEELGELYGVEADGIQAAARVLVGRYGVQFIPEQDRYRDLGSSDSRRLVNLQRAILYGVDVSGLESGVTMLGE